ncbi:sel1 repeat family protein [Aggregicoccus sp. 17bor-14]|uniref:tetratricopeptide repeat protein n=1 Tax=Myxococcaceae TaxID=31 RepID=UPI00129C4197|nr:MULTISPECIES: tetratricopeptide repeat protein [Myxococcaceae]MBF5043628.1 sel1 repeat family protein [Simulacricoccus sp. 17bor-14]MRI89387.1 sel1 repeat family protein [Aggregicoccus sp. 17bor-14]
MQRMRRVQAAVGIAVAAGLLCACAGAPPPARAPAAGELAAPPALPDPQGLRAQLQGRAPGGVLSELPPERAEQARLERDACAGTKSVRGRSACALRAEQYARGEGAVAVDEGLAAALHEQACALGHWQSCAQLGLTYAEGTGVRASPERSAQLYWLACANGPIPAACLNLGLQYAEGQGVAQSDAVAEAYYARACEEHLPQGCRNLEALREARREAALAPERAAQVPNASFRALPPDKAARVRPELLKCFDTFSRTHCNDLGVDYARGLEVARDEAIAAAFFEQACHLGESAACTNLTSAALAARAHARPLASAERVLSEACDAGQAVACSELGAQALVSARAAELLQGTDAHYDAVHVRALFGRACTLGLSSACAQQQAR